MRHGEVQCLHPFDVLLCISSTPSPLCILSPANTTGEGCWRTITVWKGKGKCQIISVLLGETEPSDWVSLGSRPQTLAQRSTLRRALHFCPSLLPPTCLPLRGARKTGFAFAHTRLYTASGFSISSICVFCFSFTGLPRVQFQQYLVVIPYIKSLLR